MVRVSFTSNNSTNIPRTFQLLCCGFIYRHSGDETLCANHYNFNEYFCPITPNNILDSKRTRLDVSLRGQNPDGTTRTSRLLEPNMLLTGHEGEIFAVRASSDGEILASAGFDQKILLWNIYGECENFSTLTGHKGAVMEGWLGGFF